MWDNAFFAQSEVESLLWAEDPGDHVLISDIPALLIRRALQRAGGAMFVRPAKSTPAGQDEAAPALQISVIRDGKRRISVPIRLRA